VDIPRQHDDQNAANKDNDELCKKEWIRSKHCRGFWGQVQEIEGVGPGECLAHRDCISGGATLLRCVHTVLDFEKLVA
jgi:hypothetical protein